MVDYFSNDNGCFTFYVDFIFLHHRTYSLRGNMNRLPFTRIWVHSVFFVGSLLLVYLVFCVVFFVLFFFVLCFALPVSLDCPFLISPSVFSNVYVVAVDFIRLQKSTLVGMLRWFNFSKLCSIVWEMTLKVSLTLIKPGTSSYQLPFL